MAPLRVSAFTLNCWGVPVGCQHLEERMKAIGEFLATTNHDIVFLQEVWRKRDFTNICAATRDVYPYTKYFYAGQIGSGVCVLSKRKFVRADYRMFKLNGVWWEVWHGDNFGGKGTAHVRLLVDGLIVDCYSTHLHANYAEGGFDGNLSHRVSQSFDMCSYINMSSCDADLVIVAGDMNLEPHDLGMQLLLPMAGLTDCWESVNPGVFVGTCDTPDNPYTPKKAIANTPQGKRIDYMMYRSRRGVNMNCVSTQVLNGVVANNSKIRLSDHKAIVSQFEIKLAPNRAMQLGDGPALRHTESEVLLHGFHSYSDISAAKDALMQCQTLFSDSVNEVKASQRYWLFCLVVWSFFLVFLALLSLLYWPITIVWALIWCFVLAQFWFVKRVELSHLMETLTQIDVTLDSDDTTQGYVQAEEASRPLLDG